MNFSTNIIKVYIGLFLAMFFWGFSFIATKYSLNFLNPISLVLIRLIISVIFLFILGNSLKLLDKIKPHHWKWFIILAFFEPFLYFMGETYGLKYISATIGAIIISTIPLFVPIGAWFFFKEKLYWKNLIGIVFSIVGVVLTLLNKNMEFTVSILGIVLVFIAVISAIVYTLIIRFFSKEYSALSIIAYQNILGIPMFIPFFIFIDYQDFSFNIELDLWLILLWLGIFPSSLSYLFYTYSVQNIGVNKTSVFVNLIPVITAVFSYFLLNEEFTIVKFIGITVVIFGLYISQLDYKKS